jgi:hypothetical protein
MRKVLVPIVLFLFLLTACSPKAYSEQDLAAVKLSDKDLPAGFVESPADSLKEIDPFVASLEKVFFNAAASGKTVNPAMFSKETEAAAHGILSFEYFPLSATEKQQLVEIAGKQDAATCCEMISAFMGGNETTCKNSEFTSLVSVIPGMAKIADGSLGCSVNIQGNSTYEIGYIINKNVVSVIFEGFSQYNQSDTITPLLDLKAMLTLMNGKLASK